MVVNGLRWVSIADDNADDAAVMRLQSQVGCLVPRRDIISIIASFLVTADDAVCYGDSRVGGGEPAPPGGRGIVMRWTTLWSV